VALGLYDRSYNLVVRPTMLLMAPMSRVAIPVLSRLAEDPAKYRAAYLQIVRGTTILLLPAMLVCISNARTLIEVLLGPRWLSAAPIFAWLCVGGLTSGLYASASWLLVSQARTKELRRLTFLAAVINVASYLLGAIWGVVGVAVSASLNFVFLTTPLLVIGTTRRGPVDHKDMIAFCAPFLFAGAGAYIVLTFGLGELPLHGALRLVVMTLASYALVTILCLVSAENRRLLGSTGQLLRDLR